MKPPEDAAPPPPKGLTLAPTGPKPPPPLPGSAPASPTPALTRRLSRQHESATRQSWLVRASMALLLAGAGCLLVWSLQRLLPLQRQTRDAAALASRLSGEIAIMEGRYTPAEIEQVLQSYTKATNRLFATPEAIKDWLQEVHLRTLPLAIEASAEFGDPVVTNTPGHELTVMPARLSLVIQPSAKVEAIQSPYLRVLRVLDELVRQEKRADIVEIQVAAGTNSIARATTLIEVWTGKETKP